MKKQDLLEAIMKDLDQYLSANAFWDVRLDCSFDNIRQTITKHLKASSDIDKQVEEKEYNRLENDYACVLDHATMWRMSKTNYYLNDIYWEIDSAQEKHHMEYIWDDVIEILKDWGTIEDIKEYFWRDKIA